MFRIATVGKVLISGITGRSLSALLTLTGQTYAGDSTPNLFQPRGSFADSGEYYTYLGFFVKKKRTRTSVLVRWLGASHVPLKVGGFSFFDSARGQSLGVIVSHVSLRSTTTLLLANGRPTPGVNTRTEVFTWAVFLVVVRSSRAGKDYIQIRNISQ